MGMPGSSGTTSRGSYGGLGSAGSLGGVGLGSPGRLGGMASPVRVGSGMGPVSRMTSLGSSGRISGMTSPRQPDSPESSDSQTPGSGGGPSRHSYVGGMAPCIGQRPVQGTNRHSFAGGLSGPRSTGSLSSLGKAATGSRHSYAGGLGSGGGAGVVVNPLGQTYTLVCQSCCSITP